MTGSPGGGRSFHVVRNLVVCTLGLWLAACNLPEPSNASACPNAPAISVSNYYLCVGHTETVDSLVMSYRLQVDPAGESCVVLEMVEDGPGSRVYQVSDGRIQFVVEGWLGGPDGRCNLIGHPILVETVSGTCEQTGKAGYLQLSITEEWEDVSMTLQCPGGPTIPFGEVIRTGHRVPEERPFYLAESGTYEIREEADVGGATSVSVWTLLIDTVPLVPIAPTQ